jgi:hypothetical protein
MIEPLRPMSTGQLLDYTFALYRKNFWLFVGIAVLGPLANVIFQLITVGANVAVPFAPRRGGMIRPSALPMLGMTMFFGYIILLAGMAISHAATVKAVAAVHLGLRTSIVAAYKSLRGCILSLFGTGILIVLVMIAAAIGIMIVCVPLFFALGALARTAPRPAAGLLVAIGTLIVVLLFFVAIVLVYVRYALAIQACVVENLPPRASLKRSVFLSKGSRWRVFAIYLVFVSLAFILGWGLAAIAAAAGAPLHNKIAAAVLIYLAGFVAGSITGPLATIGLSLLYYDERVRKEAFDLQLMLASLDAPPAAMPVPAQI